jgi:exopolysaccharide biosynthesis protein
VIWLVLVVLGGCSSGDRSGKPQLGWQPIDSLNALLPDGVQAFRASDPDWPLRAWYVRADPGSDSVRLDILHSDESEGRETTSSFAYDQGACVTLNAGYFRMDLSPSRPIGLLLVDSAIVQRPTPSVLRNEVSYPVARAAIGIDGDGNTDIAWVASTDSGLVALNEPPPNVDGKPVDGLDSAVARVWPMVEAVSAGPSLVSAGTMRVTVNEEVFFGSAIPEVHPRSAIGLTSDGEILMLVVDGRQSVSRGVDLTELAGIMIDLGAIEAMNLDGGGSSTLVVDGIRLNRPAGRDTEREVASAVAVFCE